MKTKVLLYFKLSKKLKFFLLAILPSKTINMDKYPYNEQLVKELDEILDFFKSNRNLEFDIYDMTDEMGKGREETDYAYLESCFDILVKKGLLDRENHVYKITAIGHYFSFGQEYASFMAKQQKMEEEGMYRIKFHKENAETAVITRRQYKFIRITVVINIILTVYLLIKDFFF